MTEAIGWTGIVMAIAAMVRGELSAYTARKVARDKLEFDAELQALKVAQQSCADRDAVAHEREARTQAALDKCQAQHAESEKDRAEMKGRLSVMETIIVSHVKAPAA